MGLHRTGVAEGLAQATEERHVQARRRCRMPASDESNEPVPASEPHGELSRRRFLQGTALTLGAALASAGIYELIDSIAYPPERAAFAATEPLQEQYILQNEQVIEVNGAGVESSAGTIGVRVPALHDHVITATVKVPANANALQEAQQHLESVLLGLEQQFPPTPTGLGIALAWGLPYFHHYIPSLGKTSPFFTAGRHAPTYLAAAHVATHVEGDSVYARHRATALLHRPPPPGVR